MRAGQEREETFFVSLVDILNENHYHLQARAAKPPQGKTANWTVALLEHLVSRHGRGAGILPLACRPRGPQPLLFSAFAPLAYFEAGTRLSPL